MLKKLIEVTSPTKLKIAKGVKQDLEEKGCKVYLVSAPYRYGKNQGKKYVIWREPDEEDRENELKTKRVEI